MVYALAFGLSIGATALVARRMGEKDAESRGADGGPGDRARLLFGIGLSAAGAIFAPDLLRRWAARRGSSSTAFTSPGCMLGANVSVCLLFLINAIFRGAGDAAIAMRALWLANGINIVLGPCLDLRGRALPGARRGGRGGRDLHRSRRRACCTSCTG